VASPNKPTPIPAREIDKIMQQMQEGVEKPRPKVLYEVGEQVRIKDGPFTDFNGNVEEVNYEKSKVRVSVTIFRPRYPGRTRVRPGRKSLSRQHPRAGGDPCHPCGRGQVCSKRVKPAVTSIRGAPAMQYRQGRYYSSR
jgi:hypothetical protein